MPGKRVLDTILKNVNVAEDENNLVCQDTGIAVYYCRVGEGFPLHPARIYEALYNGTERATIEHPLRSNRGSRCPDPEEWDRARTFHHYPRAPGIGRRRHCVLS